MVSGAVAFDGGANAANPVKPSFSLVVSAGGVFLLLVVGVVPWRHDVIYTGGADIIVMAKAVVALIAFLAAAMLRMRVTVLYRIGLGPAGVLTLVALLSLLGSLTSGHFSATLVLVVRMFLLMGTVLLLLTCLPWNYAFVALLSSMGILAVFAATTGLGTLATGRLAGGVPQIHPNELSALASASLVGVAILILRTRLRLWHLVAATILFGIMVASGSRSPIIGVTVAIAVAALTNGRLQKRVAIGLTVSVPLIYFVIMFTGFLSSVATRGGTEDAASALDSRWDAWTPVLAWPWGSWKKWIGQGLSVKEVKVDVKWLDTQVLDSSWVSLLAQAGIVGTMLVALLIAWGILKALASPSRRGVVLPLLLLLTIRSFTESGLVDSTVQMVLLLMTTTVLTGRSQRSSGEPREYSQPTRASQPVFGPASL